MGDTWEFIQRFLNVFAILSAISGSAWYISNQFNSVKSLVHTTVNNMRDVILAKLEYHERHDDERFEQVHKELWEIKLHNASVDEAVREAKIRLIKEGEVKVQ